MYMILWYFIASHSHRIRAATCSLAYGLLCDANIMICAGNGIVFNLIHTASLYFVINYWLNYFSLATNDVCDSGDGGRPLLGLQFQVSYPPTLDRSIDVQLSSLYVAISPSYKSLVKWTRSDRKVSPPQRPRHFPLKPLLLSCNNR